MLAQNRPSHDGGPERHGEGDDAGAAGLDQHQAERRQHVPTRHVNQGRQHKRQHLAARYRHGQPAQPCHCQQGEAADRQAHDPEVPNRQLRHDHAHSGPVQSPEQRQRRKHDEGPGRQAARRRRRSIRHVLEYLVAIREPRSYHHGTAATTRGAATSDGGPILSGGGQEVGSLAISTDLRCRWRLHGQCSRTLAIRALARDLARDWAVSLRTRIGTG